MSSNGVLVLNDNYQPLNVTNARRAIGLLCLGKAHVVESDSHVFHSELLAIDLPTVVRLNHHVRRPMPILRVSRKSIFARDHYTCQYCGTHNAPLTIDHVVPRAQGGQSTWDNCVLACIACNHGKADRTPQQAGMRLKKAPVRPGWSPTYSRHKVRFESWRKFVSEAYWNAELGSE